MQVKVLVIIVDVEAQEPPSRIGLGGGSSHDREPGAPRDRISIKCGQEQDEKDHWAFNRGIAYCVVISENAWLPPG
jgi:hypothetical protein